MARTCFLLAGLMTGLLMFVGGPAHADDPPSTEVPDYGPSGYMIESLRQVPVGETLSVYVRINNSADIQLPVLEIDPPNAPRRTLELRQVDESTHVAEVLIGTRGFHDIYADGRLNHLVEGTQVRGLFGTRSPMFLIAGAAIALGIVGWVEAKRRRIQRRGGQPPPGVTSPRAQDSWWG